MNLFLRKGLLAAALGLVSLTAQAQPVISLAPMPGAAVPPADPTAKFATSARLTGNKVRVIERTTKGAKDLLASAEGPAWRVLQVKAPTCTTQKGKECRQLKAQCLTAEKFVKKHGGHAACSALYATTTVLLSNDAQNPLSILGK